MGSINAGLVKIRRRFLSMHRQHVMCTSGRGMLTSSGCVRGEVLVGMRCEREDAATVILDLFERVGRRGGPVLGRVAVSVLRSAALVLERHPGNEEHHGGRRGVCEPGARRKWAWKGVRGQRSFWGGSCCLTVNGDQSLSPVASKLSVTVTGIYSGTAGWGDFGFERKIQPGFFGV